MLLRLLEMQELNIIITCINYTSHTSGLYIQINFRKVSCNIAMMAGSLYHWFESLFFSFVSNDFRYYQTFTQKLNLVRKGLRGNPDPRLSRGLVSNAFGFHHIFRNKKWLKVDKGHNSISHPVESHRSINCNINVLYVRRWWRCKDVTVISSIRGAGAARASLLNLEEACTCTCS